jgi:hypothetical protein
VTGVIYASLGVEMSYEYETITVTHENIESLQDLAYRKLRIGDSVLRPLPIGDLFSPENETRRWYQALRLAGLLVNN